MPDQTLLDPAFLKKLERLRIQGRRAFPGSLRGERRSTRRGASVEFADFRKYEAGDDFRHVDWNIYARLERLMLRQFVEEEDVRIDLLVDQSQSMHFGEGMTKFDFARRAAAALSFLAISSLDQVGLAVYDSAVRGTLRASRGRGHLLTVLNFLESKGQKDFDPLPYQKVVAAADGEGAGEGTEKVAHPRRAERTNLSAVLRSYQKTTRKPGILFIISDFLDETDFRAELRLLAQRKFDVNLVQVLASEETNPESLGDLLLVDAETGVEREITVNERAITAYQKTLAQFTTSLEVFCRKNGIGYTFFKSSTSFEDQLLKNLIESRIAG